MSKPQSFDSLEAADARFLRRLLTRAVRNALAAPLALGLSACAASPKLDTPVDPSGSPPGMPTTPTTPTSPTPLSPAPKPGTSDPKPSAGSVALECDASGLPQLAGGMHLAYDVDYLAEGVGGSVFSQGGNPCESAQDAASCAAQLSAAHAMFDRHLVTVEGDEVRVWLMPAALSLLGEIDSAEEAFWIALTSRYDVPCGTLATATGDGYRIADLTLAGQDVCASPASIDTIVVGPDGELDVVEAMPLANMPTCAVGRRPPGLRSAHRSRTRCALGEHFARAAHMEAASVPAFAAISRELAQHGAPFGLRLAAARAERDEVRHARMMSRLARRFGVTPVRPVVERAAVRSRLALALDNAVEGCVNEAYAALEATHQAAVAADAQVRAVHAVIAADETRHAAFSFALQRWLEPQLGAGEREQVQAARAKAVATLGRALMQARVPRSLQVTAGLPAPETALALHAALASSVWS